MEEKYIELIDKYRITQSTDTDYNPPSYDWVDNTGEIVRCKDCKHGTRLVCDLAGNEGIECRHGNIAHRLDWFCADGAKMDGEA